MVDGEKALRHDRRSETRLTAVGATPPRAAGTLNPALVPLARNEPAKKYKTAQPISTLATMNATCGRRDLLVSPPVSSNRSRLTCDHLPVGATNPIHYATFR
jgi:hypothetical protein